MRILFLTDNFPPETNAPATRTYEHCIKWINMGYRVTIITCFPNFPKGKVFEGYTNKLYQKENIDGITVIRVWSYISENNGFLKRIIDYVSYAVTSFLFGLFVKTDLIIATSPQFFTAISGRMLSFFKRIPWVMEVRDLWPDSIAAVGSMNKSSIPFKVLKKIEHHLYLSASKIIVVTDSFKKYLIEKHQINQDKIGVFKNGVLVSNFKTPQANAVTALKKSLGLQNKTIVSYIGTHGLAHGLKFIFESISKISNPTLHFLFIGDGAEKQNLIEYSKTLKLKNYTFLDSITKREIPLYIDLSDYSLVNLKKSDEFKNVIPSKIFENIAMYKPILLGVEGESKKLIENYKVGVCFEPDNTKSFIDAVSKIQFIDDFSFKENCNKMLNDFNRDKIAEDLIKYIVE
ncbi:glycosyltransferase family 4 protein [Flavobacteriales bacterium]|nr:glycosyltransferase family 4 protein [Flavobacteriales bacterium]